MTQQSADAFRIAMDQAWTRIGRDRWSQMKWFIDLANKDFEQLSAGDTQNLLDECMAIHLVPFHSILSDRMRYPYKYGSNASTPQRHDLQNIRAAIAPPLNNLADGRDAKFGPVSVSHTTTFRRATDNERQAGYPPYLIFPMATISIGSHTWQNEFLLRTAQLLEETAVRKPGGKEEKFVDRIRRCPHCQKLFVQLRGNAAYCGRTCHSVAGMRKRRAVDKAQTEVTLQRKKQSLKNNPKGRSSNGKKTR
ncbi:hypothetical protein YTPLAS72_21450 [Nitrospira sp.]|nr:hypothetical protein YTPLAS72_21450 [Nitrospira sp.]